MKQQRRMRMGGMLALAAVALVITPQLAAAGNWSVKNVSELVAAINAANQAGGVNTINLAPGRTFTLTVVNNATDGPNGLPVIAANNNLTIRGSGATLARSKAAGTPAFRLFDVAPGASLTLESLTLANGLVVGDTGQDADGGAILNATGASLTVKCSVLLGNQVVGGDGGGGLGGRGLGGAIRSDGIANLDRVVFRGNQATGGATTSPEEVFGGNALGGAVSSGDEGNLTVKNCWFTGNKATGGFRHYPNPLYNVGGGGALDNWGIALITDSEFTDNQAIGAAAEPGVEGGYGLGGALKTGSVWALSPVCTIRHCTFSHNQAVGADAATANDDFGGTGIGGALHTGFAQISSVTTITDCTFNGNEAISGLGGCGQGAGGAINQEQPLAPGNQSLLTIVNTVFAANKAIGKGGGSGIAGAILNDDWSGDDGYACTLVISNSLFVSNVAMGSPGGENVDYESFAAGGALYIQGNTAIQSSTFLNNRAIGGAWSPAAPADYTIASLGGGLASWLGTLDIRDSCFIGNQVSGGDASLGGPPAPALGGGIFVVSDMTANIVNTVLRNNTAVGGAGSGNIPGADGVGGALAVGFAPVNPDLTPSTTTILTGATISRNQAIGGSNGGHGKGGGYAVDIGVLFGFPDTSTVTLNGGSVVNHNQPDDMFQF